MNQYDKYREQIAAFNAAHPKLHLSHEHLTVNMKHAARPFILFGPDGRRVGAYGSIEAAEKKAASLA